MSGYYPAGVTGNEFEIAGPDFEKTITVGPVECTGHNGRRINIYKPLTPENTITDCKCSLAETLDDDDPNWVPGEFDQVEVEAAFFEYRCWGEWVCPSCGHPNDWEGDAEDYDGRS